MSKTQFTPGPWGLKNAEAIGPVLIVSQFLRPVAAALTIEPLQSTEGQPVMEKLANADLIKVAPEMYQALENLVRLCIVQNEDTDGYVVCMGCGLHCDPQEYETYGIEHERYEGFVCPVDAAQAAMKKGRGE